ncbi:MAG: hypothetical protein U0003_05690, partial [Vampirovibrionales bacterium]
DNRYIDYATIGYLGSLVMAFVYEFAIRLSENIYSGRNLAQHVVHWNRLSDYYHLPKTSGPIKNFRSLDGIPDLAARVSGSMSNRESLDVLAQNKGEALWQSAHGIIPNNIPGHQKAAWLQFNRRFNYYHLGNLNRKMEVFRQGQTQSIPYLTDFIGLTLQKDSHIPTLYDMLKPYQLPNGDELVAPGIAKQLAPLAGQSYQQLSRHQANLLRHALEEYQLTQKLFSQLCSEPPKKYLLFGPPKATSKAPLAQNKMALFQSVNWEDWLSWINQSHDPKTTYGKIKALLKDTLNSRDFIDPLGKEDYQLAKNICPERLSSLNRAFQFIQNALKQDDLNIKPFQRPGDSVSNQALESLFEHLSQRFKGESDDIQRWLKAYLHDGMLAQQSKKMMTSLNKSQFWLTMAVSVVINYLSHGTALTLLQMNWAIPLQKKLTAEGVSPKKVMKWPMTLSPLVGIGVYAALMHQGINKHLPYIGKAFLSLNRLARHTVAGLLGLGLTGVTLLWGLNRNIRSEQQRLKKEHPLWGQKVIPQGMKEVKLNPYRFQQFAISSSQTR